MIFKVAFGKQIHLINSQDKLKLRQLLSFIPTIFKALPSRYTLTYLDIDGDEITLEQQEDYQVLLASGFKTAKISIRENLEEFVDQTNQIVIQEYQELKEEEKKPSIILDEQKDPESSFLTQEIDDSLIEEKLKKLLPDIISKVKSEINEELNERSRISSKNEPIIIEEPNFYKVNEKKSEEPKPNSGKVVHSGVTCDSCNRKNIEGVRYKCSVCSNYDFCETCQATVEHAHPFLKIKTLKQTPLKIFTVINEENDGPSFEANGQRFEVPPQFENLVHHGIDIVRGFLGGAKKEELRHKCHAAKQEWKKRSEEWKKTWNCPQKCEEKPEKKNEEKTEVKVEPKVEAKEQPKVEPKVQVKEDKPKSACEDVIKGNANYLVEVFGYSFEKCLKWAQMFPYMTKEELLSYCLSQPNFYN